jgi:hypothetical protein
MLGIPCGPSLSSQPLSPTILNRVNLPVRPDEQADGDWNVDDYVPETPVLSPTVPESGAVGGIILSPVGGPGGEFGQPDVLASVSQLGIRTGSVDSVRGELMDSLLTLQGTKNCYARKIASELMTRLGSAEKPDINFWDHCLRELAKLSSHLKIQADKQVVPDEQLKLCVSFLTKLCQAEFDEVNLLGPTGLLKALQSIGTRFNKFNDLGDGARTQIVELQVALGNIAGVPTIKDWAAISHLVENINSALSKNLARLQNAHIAFFERIENERKEIAKLEIQLVANPTLARRQELLDRIELLLHDVDFKEAYVEECTQQFSVAQRNLLSIATCFDHVLFLSKVGWSAHAFNESAKIIGQTAEKTHNSGYSRFTTWAWSIRIKFKKLLSFALGYIKQYGRMVDDERYMAKVSLNNLDLGLAGGPGWEVLGTQVGFQAGGNLSGTRGKYLEYNRGLHYASSMFDEAITDDEYQNNPELRRYYSRAATINDGQSDGDRSELHNVTTLFEQYDARKDELAKFFSNVSETLQSTPPELAPLPIINEGDYFQAKMTKYTGRAHVAGGGLSKTSFIPGAKVEYVCEKTMLDAGRHHGFCAKLSLENIDSEPWKSTKRLLDERSQNLRHRLIQPGGAWRRKIGVDHGLNLKSAHTLLRREHENYCELQRLAKLGNEFAKKEIINFHRDYGAKDNEDCIARMLLLNAWICSETMGNPDLGGLRPEAIQLESALLDPKFKFFDRQKVNEMISYKEDIQFSLLDHRFSLSSNGTQGTSKLPVADSAGGSPFSMQFRNRIHHNVMRVGKYTDKTWNIGLNPTADTGTISEFASWLRSDPATATISGDFSAVTNISGSGNERFYNRGGFDALKDKKQVLLYSRKLVNTEVTVGSDTGDLPVAPGVDLGFSAGVDSAKTDTYSEIYNHKTIFMFALMYTHEFGSGFGNPDTGDLAPGNNWQGVVLVNQRPSLEKLFKEVAQESQLEPLDDGLLVEMQAIEDQFIRCGFIEDSRKFKRLRENFIDAAKAYAKTPTAELYKKTLVKFEALLFSYVDPIKNGKKTSPLFKPGVYTIPET